MGIVINQSVRNTIITYLGFAIGAINTLFMYPKFLGETFFGLTGYILSSANIVMPIMAFGVHNTLIKFFSQQETDQQKSEFFTFILILPLLFIVPLLLFSYFSYETIATFLSRKNPIIYNYVWIIPIVGFCMAYFEIFYAWVKAHYQSVFGSFVKEIALRILISIFLFGVYFQWITLVQFIFLLVGAYFLITVIMFVYAYKVHPIQMRFKLPQHANEIMLYSVFIILSGSIANILLDIDKNMIGQYIKIENVAYYSVAIFIATVISVPSRAMHQITYPITAKLMAENKHEELNDLYKKASISLQIIGGLVYLGILVNIHQLYELLPKTYSGGIYVVFVIGLSKYFDLILGNNNAIIFNSKYYKAVLFLGLLLVVLTVGLNMLLIPLMGIEGAALAALISISIYCLAKLLFVVFKMKLFPFTKNTIVSFAISLVCFLLFYYWEFPFIPIINIFLKSILLTVLYLTIHYLFKVSLEVNGYMQSFAKKILK